MTKLMVNDKSVNVPVLNNWTDDKLFTDPFAGLNIIDKMFNNILLGNKGLTQFLSNSNDDLLNVASIGNSFPKYQISTTEDGGMLLEIALAGYPREALSVSVDGNVLIVSAKKDESDKPSKVIARRAFTERFTIGANLDTTKTEVVYKDGLLSVRIPLLAEKVKRELVIG